MKEFVQLKFPVRFGDGQFFAKKPVIEEEEEEEEEEEDDEPVTKTKGKESRPSWVDELLAAVKPQAPSKSKMEVPVPKAPAVEETEEEEEPPKQEPPKKKGFLDWFL